MVICEVKVINEPTDTQEHTDIVDELDTDWADSKRCSTDGDVLCADTQIPSYLDAENNVGAFSNSKLDTAIVDETSDKDKSDKEVVTDNTIRPTDENIVDGIDDSVSKSDRLSENFRDINHKSSDTHENIAEKQIDSFGDPVIAIADVSEEITPEDHSQTDNGIVENEVNNNKNVPLEEDKKDGEQNSTIVSWLKYLIEPFIEEFKEGIYTKTTDTANDTDANITESSSETNGSVDALSNVTVVSLDTNETDSSNSNETAKKVKFQCSARNVTGNASASVSVVSSSRLLQLLSFDKNETENSTDCLVVMFYAPWCHFCANTAPHYNALARAFPALEFVAVDTAQFSNLLARFGTVSVPNILVFHQSRAAVKFNQTERTFENFVSFVKNSTGLEPNVTVNVTDTDYLGPVPSVPTDDPDYLLWLAWTFVVFYSSCMFVKSNRGQQWIMRVRVLWQEHQHID